jgi:hypothetical protein
MVINEDTIAIPVDDVDIESPVGSP